MVELIIKKIIKEGINVLNSGSSWPPLW